MTLSTNSDRSQEYVYTEDMGEIVGEHQGATFLYNRPKKRLRCRWQTLDVVRVIGRR